MNAWQEGPPEYRPNALPYTGEPLHAEHIRYCAECNPALHVRQTVVYLAVAACSAAATAAAMTAAMWAGWIR